MRLTYQELIDLATRHGFPDPSMAAAVAIAESGGDTCANGDPHNPSDCTNPYTSKSFGLWQIDTVYHAGTKAGLTDPDTNAATAYNIFKAGGKAGPNTFSQWSTAWEDPVKKLGYLGPNSPAMRYYRPSPKAVAAGASSSPPPSSQDSPPSGQCVASSDDETKPGQ